MTPETNNNDESIGSIGISLSGGGFRATSFHLGTLDYLDHCGLTPQLRSLSAVSGGSFTAAKYALAMAEKTPHHVFFRDLYLTLRDYTAVKLAVENFSKKPQTPSERQKLIVTVAQTYADTWLRDKDGNPALFGTILNSDMQLEEVTISAVEFCQGLEFSFQKTNNKNVHIGNRNLSIPREEAAKIRLADVVAASHCIPLVFEPMAFPDDFVWPDGQVPPFIRNLFSREGKPNPVALMDGGLLDNQGMDSILLTEGRDPHNLGMYIISDASLLSNNFYPLSSDSVPGRIKLGHISNIANIILGFCFLTKIGRAHV